MAKWTIDKEHSFDYGHRVWTQKPDEELSCGHQSVCRHLHGHRGTVKVFLTGTELDKQGMVTDFVNLNWFKKFVDEVLDHKMILDIIDPLTPFLFPTFKDGQFIYNEEFGYYFIDPNLYATVDPGFVQELFEGMVFVDFVPTSENLSKWLFECAQKKMATIGVTVEKIEFFETPKSRSTYYGNQ